MRKAFAGALLSGALAIAGCATSDRGGETQIIGPDGRVIPPSTVPISGTPTLRLLVTDQDAASTGAVNTFYLHPDGTGQLVVEPNEAAVDVRWAMPDANSLCFDWPVRGRECWPYQSLRVGQPVRVTSDRDVTADITLLRALQNAQQPAMQQPAMQQPAATPTPRPVPRAGERG